eukprot:1916887-Pyramimonas_sp.AAC.1
MVRRGLRRGPQHRLQSASQVVHRMIRGRKDRPLGLQSFMRALHPKTLKAKTLNRTRSMSSSSSSSASGLVPPHDNVHD